jgi:hypothetical protein
MHDRGLFLRDGRAVRFVNGCGVELTQGYFHSKPAADPLGEADATRVLADARAACRAAA